MQKKNLEPVWVGQRRQKRPHTVFIPKGRLTKDHWKQVYLRYDKAFGKPKWNKYKKAT